MPPLMWAVVFSQWAYYLGVSQSLVYYGFRISSRSPALQHQIRTFLFSHSTAQFRTTMEFPFFIVPTSPPRFGDTLGVTIGRNIYVRQSADTRFLENAGFPNATHILLHEFTHSKQYQGVGYSLAAFGTQYLFNFCKVSLGYFSYL